MDAKTIDSGGPVASHQGFPPVAKTLCSQCRGPRFDSWSGNYIQHATTKVHMLQLKIPHAAITYSNGCQINKYQKQKPLIQSLAHPGDS